MLFPNYKIYLPALGNLSFCRLKAYNAPCIQRHACVIRVRPIRIDAPIPSCSFVCSVDKHTLVRAPHTYTHRVKWVLYQTNSNINYISREQISATYRTKRYWLQCDWFACFGNPSFLRLFYCHLQQKTAHSSAHSCQYILLLLLLSMPMLLLWSMACSRLHRLVSSTSPRVRKHQLSEWHLNGLLHLMSAIKTTIFNFSITLAFISIGISADESYGGWNRRREAQPTPNALSHSVF